MPPIDANYEQGSANSFAKYYQDSAFNRNKLASEERANKLGDLQYQQEVDKENQARALRSYFANKNPKDPDFEQGLGMIVGPQGVMDYRTKEAATKKARIEAMQKQDDFVNQIKRNLADNDSDENVIAWGQDAVIKGLFTKEEAEANTRELLAMPRGARARSLSMAGATAEQRKPTTVTINRGAQTDLVEKPAGGGAPTTVGTYTHILTEKEKADIAHQQGMLKVAKDRLTGELSSTGDLSPEAIDIAAQIYAQGGGIPPLGMGPKAATIKTKILNRAGEFLKGDAPLDPAAAATTVIEGKQNIAGNTAAQRTLGTTGANITAAAIEANNMIPIAQSYAVKVNPTDYPTLNSIGNYVASKTGDPNITGLATALNSLVNSYSRAINPKGAPTVSDKNHAREIINTAMAAGQLETAFAVMQQEMVAAQSAPKEARDALRTKPNAGPKAGTIQDGFRFKGGDPSKQANWEKV